MTKGPGIEYVLCIPEVTKAPGMEYVLCIPEMTKGPGIEYVLCIPEVTKGPGIEYVLCIPEVTKGPGIEYVLLSQPCQMRRLRLSYHFFDFLSFSIYILIIFIIITGLNNDYAVALKVALNAYL